MTTPAMPLTDAELIERTRTGDMTAYDELYRRHLDGAQRVARVVTGSHDEAQDVVSEAFTRVLDRLQHGGGPEGELGPYLNTIVRRLAIDRYRASRRDGLPADPTLFEVMPETDDPIARSTDRDLVRRAFETLPDRWQQVLWHTEIEGRTPAALAPTLGGTPNAVAALAYRAREGLRQAYLAVHLSADIPAECRPYVPKLAAYVRGTLSPREDEWVAAHVEDCPHCRDRRDELMLLVADLRGVLWPALLLPVVLGGTKTAAAVTGAAAAGVMGAKAGAAAGAGAGGAKAVPARPAPKARRWVPSELPLALRALLPPPGPSGPGSPESPSRPRWPARSRPPRSLWARFRPSSWPPRSWHPTTTRRLPSRARSSLPTTSANLVRRRVSPARRRSRRRLRRPLPPRQCCPGSIGRPCQRSVRLPIHRTPTRRPIRR